MERGTIRLRMGMADTHYAGNLVSGAHIIELMDDAGTELAVMIGGDEGLLASWKHIEQFVPVVLGDYLEVKTWVSRFGNTSFDWEAEVYKTCELVDKSGASSACNIIDPPVLVAKGSFVGVCPKSMNRGFQVPKEEIPYIPHNGVMWWEKKEK